jgi:hypothetical protein
VDLASWRSFYLCGRVMANPSSLVHGTITDDARSFSIFAFLSGKMAGRISRSVDQD